MSRPISLHLVVLSRSPTDHNTSKPSPAPATQIIVCRLQADAKFVADLRHIKHKNWLIILAALVIISGLLCWKNRSPQDFRTVLPKCVVLACRIFQAKNKWVLSRSRETTAITLPNLEEWKLVLLFRFRVLYQKWPIKEKKSLYVAGKHVVTEHLVFVMVSPPSLSFMPQESILVLTSVYILISSKENNILKIYVDFHSYIVRSIFSAVSLVDAALIIQSTQEPSKGKGRKFLSYLYTYN